MGSEADRVVLRIPAATVHVRLARLVASGVAGMAGFSAEEVDELRIAVDELVHLLVEDVGGRRSPGGDEVEVTFARIDRAVEVDGLRCQAGDVPDVDELVRDILAVVADQWWLEAAPAGLRFWMVKRARPDQRPG